MTKMTGKGADLFPVAERVKIPFVGKDEGLGPSSFISSDDSEEHRNSIRGIKQKFVVGEGLLKQLKQPRTLKLKDKSKGKIDKKYLKLISSGLSFDEDVIEERVTGTSWIASNERKNIFDKVRKTKKGTNLIGRCDARCGVVKHCPCLFDKKEFHSANRMKDVQSKPLPKIQSKTTFDDGFIKSTKAQGVLVDKPQLSWEEYLMSLLSRETAELVINDYTSGMQQKKLNDYLSKNENRKLDQNVAKDSQVEKHQERIKKVPSLYDIEKPSGAAVASQSRYAKEVNNGAFPIVNLKDESNNIVLDSDPKNAYAKVLEVTYPSTAGDWYDWESKSMKEKGTAKHKIVKGMHKWKGYPEMIEDNHMEILPLSNYPAMKSYVELDSKTAKKQREDVNLVRIVQDWRSKWFLEKKWENCSNRELLDGMCDINDHVRLSAVSACSKAVLGRTGEKKKAEDMEESSEVTVEKLLEKTIELLEDRCKEVQVASAISLFAMDKSTSKAKDVLLETLSTGGPPEKWAAAQCLAYSGCSADVVVKELFENVNTPDVIKHSKATMLLSRLSKQSKTVQYTLAEQLNSSSWRDRAVACQLFPSLQGPLSKDVRNKISHLMWNDWNRDVRTAAARTLGRTGNGKLVHDKLRDRLINGSESEKLDALKKISFLGIMTGRMLPAFLACLQSDYVSIRMEAAKAVSAIRLSHEEVINELLRLAREEANWRVKAHCVKAIGLVAKPNENVQDILLWCLRYEREATVRAEACQAIRNLKLDSERVVDILQDRVDVEEDGAVQREVALTLTQFGHEPTGDLSMVKAVQDEVKKLFNHKDVTGAIFDRDAQEQFEEKKQKYLMFDEEQESSKGSSGSKKRQTHQITSGKTQSSFDPILEGYKIQSQSKLSLPSFPVLPASVIDFDLKSFSGESHLSEQDSNSTEAPTID